MPGRIGRMISRILLAAGIALSGWSVQTQPARADWFYHLVETQCVPEIEYFSLRTHGLYNIELTGETRAAMAARGIYNLADMRAGRTFECTVRGRNIVFEIRANTPSGRGECGALQRGMVAVRVDGRVVYENNDTHGGCLDNAELTIRAHQYGVTVCETRYDFMQDERAPPAHTACETPFWAPYY
jgi:hypothetical protein